MSVLACTVPARHPAGPVGGDEQGPVDARADARARPSTVAVDASLPDVAVSVTADAAAPVIDMAASADTPATTDAGPSDAAPSTGGSSCGVPAVHGEACSGTWRICRQPPAAPGVPGVPCQCIDQKWNCATPCPAKGVTNRASCGSVGQICMFTDTTGKPTGDWCSCGNHLTWDCLDDLRPCEATLTVGAACQRKRPSSDPGKGNPNVCTRGLTEVCNCVGPSGSATGTWACQARCPLDSETGGACKMPDQRCAQVHLTPPLGGVYLSPCVCGADKAWTCQLGRLAP